MSVARLARYGLWLLAAALSWGCQASSGLSSVQRLDVELRVEADGSVVVHETFTLAVPAEGGRFSRHVRRERADSLVFQGSSVDGQALEPGVAGATSVAVSRGDDLDVAWTFGPSSAGERTLSFGYRADGAVAVRGTRGTLRHVAVPALRPYAIRAARIRASVPGIMHVFAGTGIAEAGWTVARTADGILAERGGLDSGAGATVVLELGIDPARITEPKWQRDDEWAGQLMPAFLSGGVFILVVGAGVLWIIRFQYPRKHADGSDSHERHVVRQGLWTSGLAAIGLAVMLGGVTQLTLSHLGIWPMALPASVLIVGLVFVAVSRRIV